MSEIQRLIGEFNWTIFSDKHITETQMKKLIFIVIALCGLAMAYTYHEAYLIGGPTLPPSIHSSGMGNLRILPPVNSTNALWAPSLLPESGFTAEASFYANHVGEDRSMPLYDTFEDRIGWSSYVSTAQTYGAFSGFISYGFNDAWLPTVAAGYAPIYDSRYTYREQIRESNGPAEDMLLGVWSIDSDGQLAAPIFGICERISKYGSIGLSVAFLSGTIEMHRSPAAGDSVVHNAYPWEAAFDYDTIYSADLSGTMINVSAVATPTDRWQIGLRYTPKVEFDESLYADLLPSRLGLGVGYRPPGYVISRVVFEAEMAAYSELAEADSDFAEMTDCWEFRLGLEHIMPSGIPLRIGAYHSIIPLADPVAKTGFTLGSGVAFGPVVANLNAGYEMSKYNHHDQFPETWLPGSPDDREDMDQVTEGILYGGIGLRVEF